MALRRTRASERGRFAFLLVALSLLLLVIAVRLVYIQIIKAPVYSAKATAQRTRDIQIPPLRGTIFDREGEPLAESVAARTIYAAPNMVKDKPGTARTLAALLGGSAEDYEEKLAKNTGFVYIARRVDMGKAKRLEALKLEGVGFLEDSRRVYPSNELGAQILGFVGVDGQGLAGIEKRYDAVLRGQPGVLLDERDPFGRPIPGGVRESIPSVDGCDILLTIDKDIQFHAQTELKAAVKKWGAKGGSVVIMNPRNGEIYAMASTPEYDPNDYRHADPQAFRNRPVSDAYEPGSTIKSVTAAAVLDKGLFTPDSRLDLPPTLRVAGHTIHDADARGAVNWSLRDIVTHSSNIGAVKLGMKLGKRRLYGAFESFGLTETTGVDFPGEAKGWLPPTDQWSGTSIASIPFGQGVSATPLQLARAVSAIANKGVLVTPHFLMDVSGDPSSKDSWPTERACSEEAAVTTTELLKNVVVEGTGKAAAVPGYVVAGKTGTAQVPENGKYAKGKYISSFIGYLPADDPQLLIEVKLDEPSKASYGGTVAAPSFSSLAQFCCDHLKIPATDAESVVVSDRPAASDEPSRTADKAKRAEKAGSSAERTSTDEVTDGSSAEDEKR